MNARAADIGFQDDTSVSIDPGVGILGVFGHLNYEPWFALAEFVDNALQSASKSREQLRQVEPEFRLSVDIGYEREGGGRITIDDNAGGIARDEFARAFKAAELPPDRSGLSEFGMGMKSAAIWFARSWRVVTTSIGDPKVYTVEFDMDSVLKDKVERLHVEEASIDVNEHFTHIELSTLNQFLPGRTLGKVRDHLREIYRGFLREDRLILRVAGLNMEYEEPEVLTAVDYRIADEQGSDSRSKVWRKDVSFELDGVQVNGWAAIRAEGRTSGNGLSLFRRGRVVVGTSEHPYRPVRVFGQSNSYRSQRLFGELEVAGLPVSHTKDGFQWHGREEDFEETLRQILDSDPLPLLKQAEGYRARQASRAEQARIRQAGENTAEATEVGLPGALTDVARGPGPAPSTTDRSEPGGAVGGFDFSRSISFDHGGTNWAITLGAVSRPAEPRWLLRHIEADLQRSSILATLTLNTSHPFLAQFALGSTDALEAVFRLSVALVVSESLLASAGDAETAAMFMRQVDTLLGAALSKRLRSDT